MLTLKTLRYGLFTECKLKTESSPTWQFSIFLIIYTYMCMYDVLFLCLVSRIYWEVVWRILDLSDIIEYFCFRLENLYFSFNVKSNLNQQKFYDCKYILENCDIGIDESF